MAGDFGVAGMISAGREQLGTAALRCVAQDNSRATCPQLLLRNANSRKNAGCGVAGDGYVEEMMCAGREQLGTAALRCVAIPSKMMRVVARDSVPA